MERQRLAAGRALPRVMEISEGCHEKNAPDANDPSRCRQFGWRSTLVTPGAQRRVLQEAARDSASLHTCASGLSPRQISP